MNADTSRFMAGQRQKAVCLRWGNQWEEFDKKRLYHGPKTQE